MAKRERIFLIIFLGGLLAYGGNWLYRSQIAARLEEKQKAIQRARKAVTRGRKLVAVSQAARLELARWKKLSLPNDPNEAIPQYQAFLLDLLEQSGFDRPTISPGSATLREGTYWRMPFDVQARGSMTALVTFLDAFYSIRLMHKVSQMTLTPLSNGTGQVVDVHLGIEALALATDAEPGEPAEGETAVAQGAYAELLRNNLLMRRGPGPQADPRRLAAQVYLTGTILTGEQPEALFYNRATGQSLALHPGEEIEAGDVHGQLIEVGTREIVLSIGDRWYTLGLGDHLGQRRSLSAAAALAREIHRPSRNPLPPNK